MKILRYPELKEMLPVSRSSIYRWVRDDGFPKPILLGTNSCGWIEEEVILWIENRPRVDSDFSNVIKNKFKDK